MWSGVGIAAGLAALALLAWEVLRVVNPANLQLAQSLMSPLAPTLRP